LGWMFSRPFGSERKIFSVICFASRLTMTAWRGLDEYASSSRKVVSQA
jgi:hypothetical protein